MDEVKQHIDDNAIAGYIDWLRSDGPKPEESILDHVASCSSCKSSILELSEMLDGQDKAEEPTESRKRKMIFILRAVALLAGVLAVAMMIQFLKPEKKSVEMAQVNDDSLRIIAPSEQLETDTILLRNDAEAEVIDIIQHDTILYAANYVPNQGLEALVSARFRSVTLDNKNNIMIPGVLMRGEELSLDLSDIEDKEIEFILVSNTGENLLLVNPKELKIEIKLNFDPGLYYWKLISSDDILMVGKFRLNNEE
ncbi:MAG: hypothetical protein KAH17_10500 [Bacteroidales bacterium]|nr:hypothetical protein [Bacteroidales bacterium]